MGKKLTVALTDRRPVAVDVDEWPVVAKATACNSHVESQASRRWMLAVRQCQRDGDDRCLVYGKYDTQFQNESDLRGGEIVDSIDDAPEALRRVAEYLDFNHRLADDCIANLPADEI